MSLLQGFEFGVRPALGVKEEVVEDSVPFVVLNA